MRRFYVLGMLTVLVFVFVVSGCNNNSTNISDETENGISAGKEVYTIKLGHPDKTGDDSIIDWTARKFAELANEYSDGRIEVEIYPANQLGEQTDQIRSVQNGSQEMVMSAVTNVSTFAPSLNYLLLPYLFTDAQQARTAIDALWEQNNKYLIDQANMRFLVWTDAGFRNLTTDEKHPVRTLDDFQGVKVRIPENPITEAAFKEFGASPVPLPVSEVFTALQQGVVSAQENAATTARTEHYYEVQKYFTDIQWQYTLSGIQVSENFFQSLPEDLQDALIKAGKETVQEERKRFDQINSEDIQFLKEQGMEFLGKPEDYDEWVERGRSVWPQFYELIGDGDKKKGKEVVDEVLELIVK